MRARWPRGLLALFFAASAGALGIAALSAGTAGAASPDAPPCGHALEPLCPPQAPAISASTSETDGTITITWTASGQGVSPYTDAPNPTPTLTWNSAPTGAPQAPDLAAVPLDGGSCTPGATGVLVCTYPWPAALVDNNYILNGNYTVNAQATDCSVAAVICSPNPTKGSGTVSVNNPAAPPANVKTTNPTASTVKVSWSPNGEPDITGYQVFRDTTLVCTLSMFPTPTSYSCLDGPPKDGSYKYKVVAYRWPPSYSTKIADQPASAPSAAVSSTVSGTSANTTTTTVAGGTTQTLGPQGFTGRPAPAKATGPGGGTGAFRARPGAATPPAAGVDTPANGDTGFQPNLPYGAQPSTTVPSDPTAIAAPPLAHKGRTSVGTIAVIGAGLLVAVIALHGLWLRSEVRRAGTLEALDPEL